MFKANDARVIELKEKIKDHLNIVDLLSSFGYGKENGKAYSCPFHSDSSPSMYIDEEEQIFNCFSCHRSGTYVHLFQEFERAKLSEEEAEKYTYFMALEKLLKTSEDVKRLVSFDTIMDNAFGVRKMFDIKDMKVYKPRFQPGYRKIISVAKVDIETHLQRMYLLQLNGR